MSLRARLWALLPARTSLRVRHFADIDALLERVNSIHDVDDDDDDVRPYEAPTHKFRSAKTFRDSCRVVVKAGTGGKGSTAMTGGGRSNKKRPLGGNGGRGGKIIVQCLSKQRQLDLNSIVKAGTGTDGNRRGGKGKEGKDAVLKIPVGTHVTVRYDSGNEKEFDFDAEKTITIARGGRGGLGNRNFVKYLTRKVPSRTCTSALRAKAGTGGCSDMRAKNDRRCRLDRLSKRRKIVAAPHSKPGVAQNSALPICNVAPKYRRRRVLGRENVEYCRHSRDY